MPDGSSIQAYQYQMVSARVVFQVKLHFNAYMIRRLDDVTAQLAVLQKTLKKPSPASNPHGVPDTSPLSEDAILTETEEVQLGQFAVKENFYRTSLANHLNSRKPSLYVTETYTLKYPYKLIKVLSLDLRRWY